MKNVLTPTPNAVGVNPTSSDICLAAKLTFMRSIALMNVIPQSAAAGATPSCGTGRRSFPAPHFQKVERVAPPSTTML